MRMSKLDVADENVVCELGRSWALSTLMRGARAFPASAKRRHCLDSALTTWGHWDWWSLGDAGIYCFVKNCGECGLLPHLADTSFMYVNTAEAPDTGIGGESSYWSLQPDQQPERRYSVGPPYLDPQARLWKLMERECGSHSLDDVRAKGGRGKEGHTPLLLWVGMERIQDFHPNSLERKAFPTTGVPTFWASSLLKCTCLER